MCEKKCIVFRANSDDVQFFRTCGHEVPWTARCYKPEPCKPSGERAHIKIKACCSPDCCKREVAEATGRTKSLILRDSKGAKMQRRRSLKMRIQICRSIRQSCGWSLTCGKRELLRPVNMQDAQRPLSKRLKPTMCQRPHAESETSV
jgi:hypothetical protein